MSQSNGSLGTPPTGAPHPRPRPASLSGPPAQTGSLSAVRNRKFFFCNVVLIHSCNKPRGSLDLIGADDKHDAVHVGLGTHFLFHLAQPAVEGVEALAQAHVVHQQHALAVLVELVAHLEKEKRKTTVRTGEGGGGY